MDAHPGSLAAADREDIVAFTEKVKGRVVDAHSHIGEMDAWQFYNLKQPVKPTVYEFADAAAYLRHLDGVGV
jgi:hypothetical protein